MNTHRPGIAFDEHSPPMRLARYRVEKSNRIFDRMGCLVTLGGYELVFGWIFLHPDTGWGLCASLLIVPVMLLGGDAYELVSYYIERRVCCPRYDRASQPRPQFEVKEGIGAWRLLIYFAVAPLPPIALLFLLKRYELINPLQLDLNLWVTGLCLSVAVMVLRIYNQPRTLRATLAHFKRVRSPDIN